MKYLIIIALLPSCSFYTEQFTFLEGKGHTVSVTHMSALQSREASRLKIERQTMDYISSINAEESKVKTDAEASYLAPLLRFPF